MKNLANSAVGAPLIMLSPLATFAVQSIVLTFLIVMWFLGIYSKQIQPLRCGKSVKPLDLLSNSQSGNLVQAIKDSILALCKSSLGFEHEFSIEGLVAVTLNRERVLLVNLNEFHNGNNDIVDDSDLVSCEASHAEKRSSQDLALIHCTNKRPRIEDSSLEAEPFDPDFKLPVIKIEPQGCEEDLDPDQLQNEIQAAQTSDTISSLSSRIVEMVQAKHMVASALTVRLLLLLG